MLSAFLYLLWRNVCLTLRPLVIESFAFLSLGRKSSLCGPHTVIVRHDSQISPPILDVVFSLRFSGPEFLIFKSSFSVLPFVACVFGVISKKVA